MVPLPIDSLIPDLLAQLRDRRSLILVAESGAGKTTRVPPAIVKQNLLPPEHPSAILLQPRRVAARAAAMRIAEENRWELGREVGYHIRFERRVSRGTRLHVMTEGILTRRLLDDPILDGVGCVILDEFHERSLHTDLAIALLREVRQTVRPDLMLIVMSATLDAAPVARFLEEAPIVQSKGRAFPVEITHGGATPRAALPERIAQLVRETDRDGDILVFLPGVGEINRTIDAINTDDLVLPLHGQLQSDDQIAALRPASKRKIIVATNIAETSLTIDGVRTVIDSGLERVASYDPRRGMDRLELQRISRASAAQRAGRAGRTAPGGCIRLWSQSEERAMDDFATPEIRRVDLAATVLALHAWGHPDPRKFGWFEAPDERTLVSAEQLLEMLGAVAAGKITDLGRKMLGMPVHPRLARLLIAAAEQRMTREGASIAALLSEKDIIRPQTNVHPSERHAKTAADSDLLVRLEILESRTRNDDVDQNALRQVLKLADELRRLSPSPSTLGEGRGEGSLLRLPLYAYPDRVCRRRTSDPSAAAMVGGGGVRLAPESSVRRHEFFIALDPRHDERNPRAEAVVRIASGIEPAWLDEMFPHEIRRERAAVYDAQRDRVVGQGQVLYRDLVLRNDKDAAVDDETAAHVLMDYITVPRAWELLWADELMARWLTRYEFLTVAMPDLNFKPITPGIMRELVESAVQGKRSLAEVRRALFDAVQGTLDYHQTRALAIEAPESITVPTGNRIKLEYRGINTWGVRDQVEPPVLAVRLQELFGMTQTPRIAGGRVAVRLHLLGPNYRPVQITDDLQSFWKTTYFQVRKDLRVRYPKHAWPEDPLTAKPEAKGTRRRQ